MRRTAVVVFVALASCRSNGDAPSAPVAPPAAPPAAMAPLPRAGEGFAVVELFTSEGCSSCPPADAALAEIVASRRAHVYAVAFHVDYWDALGWPDRFASAAFTARQNAYASAFRTSTVYTPQMIVNGAEAFTGSDRAHASTAIARALEAGSTASIELSVVPEGSAIVVRWRVANAPGAAVTIVLVERGLASQVRAGENRGKTLHHENVVRRMATGAAESTEGVRLDVPADVDRANAQIVAWAQGRANGALPIVAATRVDLSP